MESAYLETSIISYVVARPSRDVIVAGHQQTTQDWWANRRSEFECVVSQVVIDEASSFGRLGGGAKTTRDHRWPGGTRDYGGR
jgi:hypothetical protein